MKVLRKQIILLIVFLFNILQLHFISFGLGMFYVLIHFTNRLRISKKLIYLILPIGFIIVWTFILGLISNGFNMDLVRDLIIFSKIIVFIACGYVFGRQSKIEEILTFFILLGKISIFFFFIKYVVFLIIGGISFESFYLYASSIPLLSYECLFIPLVYVCNGIEHVSKRWLYAYIFAVLLIFSRTFILLSIIIFFGNLIWQSKSKIKILFIFISVSLALSGISLIKVNNSIFNNFQHKIINSIFEITTNTFDTNVEITKNWRAYENFLALNKFYHGTTREKLVGFGMGERTQLNITMKLGGTELTSIPIFHNGYAYLLVKGGLFGLIMLLIFYIITIRYLRSRTDIYSHFGIILVIILIITTVVVAGIFSGAKPNSIIFAISALVFMGNLKEISPRI